MLGSLNSTIQTHVFLYTSFSIVEWNVYHTSFVLGIVRVLRYSNTSFLMILKSLGHISEDPLVIPSWLIRRRPGAEMILQLVEAQLVGGGPTSLVGG